METNTSATQLDLIARHGTIGGLASRDGHVSGHIICADGFTLSVQAGSFMHCIPRPGWPSGPPIDYAGPYRAVEVGFPSAKPEPWADWIAHCENSADPTGTVYSYVPVAKVAALIRWHGGEDDTIAALHE